MAAATVRWTHSIQALGSSSGGISWPWQSGQSGQPIPEPVARTITPIVTSARVITTLSVASRWNRVNELSRGTAGGRTASGRGAAHSSASASSADPGYPCPMHLRHRRRPHRPAPSVAPALLALAALAALVAAACGPAGPTANGSAGASASSQPPGGAVLPVIVSRELIAGENRLVFSFVDATNKPIASPDRTATVQFRGPAGETASSPPAEFVWSIEDVAGLYVTSVDFPVAGAWTAVFETAAPGSPAQSIPFSFDVKDDASVVVSGEPAPSVDTPTLADVGGDVTKISTDAEPVEAFYETSIADALAAKRAVRPRLRDPEVLPDRRPAARPSRRSRRSPRRTRT